MEKYKNVAPAKAGAQGLLDKFWVPAFAGTTWIAWAPLALAAKPPRIDAANTAWMIVASALVLFMTLPGLALFYAGLVRAKNALSVLMQCFSITCVVTLAWVIVGYSIAFGDGG
ncbi:MAG TPA: ammonia channel protein, partial [Burkholderiales bacterium]|nr:ammonia channel protein [Burkholderiales bacterium]